MPPAELLRAALVGFDHESPMSPWAQPEVGLWPGLSDGLPAAFEQPVLREPAFTIDATTFLLWREPGDAAWRCGPVQPPPGEPDADGANPDVTLADVADDVAEIGYPLA